MLMPEVVVSIGSNYQRTVHISQALDCLEQQFGHLSLSSVYESTARQQTPVNDQYYNLVASFTTSEARATVCQSLKYIEQQCGRDRSTNDVAVDIDLLLYGDDVDNHLPHQDILQQAYVLWPLAELLPLYVHPTTQKKFQQLWKEFSGDRQLQAVDFVWRDQLISSAPVSLVL